ncbi:putative YccA/Bax inhibitor family protein [Streptomyces atratus]
MREAIPSSHDGCSTATTRAAFGLTLTLVWTCLEALRLLLLLNVGDESI